MSFAELTTEQKQTALANAYQAKIDLMTGRQVTSISYGDDAGSSSKSMNVTNQQQVETLIAELEIELGITRKKRAPITFC